MLLLDKRQVAFFSGKARLYLKGGNVKDHVPTLRHSALCRTIQQPKSRRERRFCPAGW
jgi:hypothetical protein